ncbi:hypothetical protein [Blastococcus sp. CT_GayMR16]|uniref:hypothetical protein n=1 Tax=Blastococcus sp. CT_GayMR16 TaxID=2559607 RepID=UPI001072FAA4|nr:hypothetical protein [Blastococcus sp. CT_GayMR16]TFV91123.1 hypothetical protein E4P38_00445 [Blastococcus sp. CT_GayMR16]
MNTPTKLGGYGALLAVVFAAAFGVGTDRSVSDANQRRLRSGEGTRCRTVRATGRRGSHRATRTVEREI